MNTHTGTRNTNLHMVFAAVAVLAAAALIPLLPWAPTIAACAVAAAAWVKYRRTRHTAWLLILIGATAVAAAGLAVGLGWFMVTESQTGVSVSPAAARH